MWKELRDRHGGDLCTVSKLMDLGEYMANRWNDEHGCDLRFVRCLEQSVMDVIDVDSDGDGDVAMVDV